MFNDAIRSIIDLLRIKREVKKTDLEIDRLKREKNESESLIKIASEDDIQKFDPKVRRLNQKVAKNAPRKMLMSRPVLIAIIVVAMAIMIVEGFIIYKIIFK